MRRQSIVVDGAKSLSVLSIVLALFALVFVFGACSDDDDDDDDEVETTEIDASGDNSESSDSECDSTIVMSDDGYIVSDTIGGYYYVDLGLSVCWADRNVGAESSFAYGDYFAWGETTTKDSYTAKNSVTYGVEMGDSAGNKKYDAATANWDSIIWRMPTEAEFTELIEQCSWEWKSRSGVNGYLVTGPSGMSIFLPAAGWRYETSLYLAGQCGYYWSSTPTSDDSYSACYLSFYNSEYYLGYDDCRYDGHPVRPVTEWGVSAFD